MSGGERLLQYNAWATNAYYRTHLWPARKPIDAMPIYFRTHRVVFAAACAVVLAIGGGFPSRTVFAAETSAKPQPRGKLLMIVAPEKFADGLQEYVRFKRQYLPAELVSLEEVLRSTPGVDDPEKLKRFFYDAWRERHLGYVLLVGDRDVMPVRYITTDRKTPAAFDYAFYPSDLYYGDVAKDDGSFDNWNGEHRGVHARYFGEVHGETKNRDPINYDQIHYRCQVAVGRWPVSNARQLQTIAAKSMRYEAGIRDGSHAGLHKAGLFNVQGFEDDRGRMDKIAHTLPRGWKAEELFYRDQNARFATALPDPPEILDVLNRGATLVAHVGHGAERDWAGPSDRRTVGPARVCAASRR